MHTHTNCPEPQIITVRLLCFLLLAAADRREPRHCREGTVTGGWERRGPKPQAQCHGVVALGGSGGRPCLEGQGIASFKNHLIESPVDKRLREGKGKPKAAPALGYHFCHERVEQPTFAVWEPPTAFYDEGIVRWEEGGVLAWSEIR